MSKRLIEKLPNGTRIYYDSEWQEYNVKGRDEESQMSTGTGYHTSCKQDAYDTAQAIDKES